MDGPTDAGRLPALAADLRVVLGQLRRRLRGESRLGGLTASQTSVLGLLEREGPATVTALARAEGVRPQSMGATIASLEAAGLVHGVPHPNDGRQTILDLTPACRDLVAASRAAREDWLAGAIRTRLSAAEHRDLAVGVALLERLVEAPPPSKEDP